MPPPKTNLYDRLKKLYWLDSKIGNQSECRDFNYLTIGCISFTQNRTGSWGLPSLYMDTSISLTRTTLFSTIVSVITILLFYQMLHLPFFYKKNYFWIKV